MMRSIKSMMMGGAILLGLAMCLTSCEGTLDDIFGEWSRPTGNNGNTKTTVAVKSVTLDQTTLTQTAGDAAVTLKATVTPDDATDKTVKWTSSDEKVVTVVDGVVTFVAAGTATITATAPNGTDDTADDKTAECAVTVNAAAAKVTTAPTATTGTIAAGSTTALVTAGVADGGTMMYQATTTNTKPTSTTGFSATVPTAEGRAAGTYYVWYYAKADATHVDSEISASAVAVTVTDVYAANEYKEGSWDGTKVVFTKETAASVTAVTNSDTDVTWGAGWYTVSGNVTIKGKVTLSANTNLILQDGATLTINGQLNASDKDLDIYGQMEGTGKLNVTCNDDDALYGDPGYTLHIHGGEITATATGATHRGLYFSKIIMYSGKLTATAADCYAIGFNVQGFIVYGGEVEATSNATSGNYSGIQSSSDGTLKVYGGKVKGTGGAPSGKGFDCKVQKGTSNIKFYFSDNGTTWGDGLSYGIAATAPGNRYAKAE